MMSMAQILLVFLFETVPPIDSQLICLMLESKRYAAAAAEEEEEEED